jgi:hypothetical protein
MDTLSTRRPGRTSLYVPSAGPGIHMPPWQSRIEQCDESFQPMGRSSRAFPAAHGWDELIGPSPLTLWLAWRNQASWLWPLVNALYLGGDADSGGLACAPGSYRARPRLTCREMVP